jgi:hypothetical protein
MTTFSRRSFLKGIIALASSAAIPVEIIEKATLAIETLPDTPLKAKSPAGYFEINGLIVPVTWMEISRPMGDIKRFGNSIFRLPPELDTIIFTTNHWLRFNGEDVSFSIGDKILPFELTGNGYFSDCSIDRVLINSDEPTEYTYSMACQIDQYKRDYDTSSFCRRN